MKFYVDDISDLQSVTDEILKLIKENQVFLLKGEMGNGKTTLVKEIISRLQPSENVSSPTYSIVNEYQLNENQKLFHFDLFRINDIEELIDLGFEEYLDSGHICFIEWPEIAIPLLSDQVIEIKIEKRENGREFELIF